MTKKTLIDEYLELQTCSQTRLNKIRTILKGSKKIIGKNLNNLKLEDVTKYLRELNNSDYKQWTKNDYKKIFKAFLKWHYKEKFLEWNEVNTFKEGFKGVNKLKAFNKEKINKDTLLKPEELEKLLRAASNLKWKALLTLQYEAALRNCEVRILKWKSVIFDDSRNLCSISFVSPKTKESRTVPVRDCIVHLKRWREEFQFPDRTGEDYVFPSQHNREQPLGEGTITTLIRRLSKQAGIRNIFPYIMRHTRIYEIQKKLGARMAAKFAGHSIETSEIYNHLDSDDVEEAMLERVYTTKELTPEETDALKKKLEGQEKRLKLIEEIMKNPANFSDLMQGIGVNIPTEEDFKEAIQKHGNKKPIQKGSK